MLLEVKDINVHYQKVQAVTDISIQIDDGQIVTLIGANGAGKSTTLRTISGLKRATSGSVWFDGERIDQLAPEKIVHLGIAHVPEGRQVFPDLSVNENLLSGAFLRKDRKGIARDLEEVHEHFPDIEGAAQTESQDAQRRRAADGRHRPRIDVEPALDSDGRAIARPRPGDGAGGGEDHPRNQ